MSEVAVVHYVTSSKYKREENEAFRRVCLFEGKPIDLTFRFEMRDVPILETLEIDLAVMVQAEVTAAYSQLRVPCIVEHAGLIFGDYKSVQYPGGLTKPMWNSLGDHFLEETNSRGRKATARAVIAYCDGRKVQTFIGETDGTLAQEPRGSRAFYWDTIFIPDNAETGNLTYAEIVDDPKFGLDYKVATLSQSSKAMLKFLAYFHKEGAPYLWRDQV